MRNVGSAVDQPLELVTKAAMDAAIQAAIDAALDSRHGVWVDHTTNALAIAAGFTSTTDFRIDNARYIVLAKTCWWWVQATRLTATYTAPANGDATNVDIFGFPATLRPSSGSIGFVNNGNIGSQRSAFVQSTGIVRLSAMTPTSQLVLNTQYDFAGGHVIV